MKMMRLFLVLISMMVVSINAFSLTCPEEIRFTCVEADPSLCKDIENPTICTMAGLGQTWDFLAPDTHVIKSNFMESLPGKSSCSILPSNHYAAQYGLSYYGKLSDGKGGYFVGAYCLYVINNSEIGLAGLISKEYAYDPTQRMWTKREDGWVCQDAKRCGFIKILSRG